MSVKSNFGHYAAKHGIAVVFPDTSPRGDDIPSSTDDTWWFGKGAGYYVDATTDKFKKNYNMYSYISKELPEVINSHFHVNPER